MMKFTFLTKEQLWGKQKLEIFKNKGAKAAITDFAIISGGYVSNNYSVSKTNRLEDRTGYYWTQTADKDNNIYIVNEDGDFHLAERNFSSCGCRIALLLEEGDNFYEENSINPDAIETEYGHYPQNTASKQLQQELEYLFQNQLLQKIKKTYTFSNTQYCVYEYETKKYIRATVNLFSEINKITLSNGESYQNGDNTWIEIEPVKWLKNKDKKIFLSKKIIYSGLEFSTINYYGDFTNTPIEKFINGFFKKDLLGLDTEKEKIDKKSKVLKESESLDYQINRNNNILFNLGTPVFSFDLLTSDQASKLLNSKIGMSAVATPFALLERTDYSKHDQKIFGHYWTKSTGFASYELRRSVVTVGDTNNLSLIHPNCNKIGGRPIIIFDELCSFLRNPNLKIDANEMTIELGNYPQDIASYELQQELEDHYQDEDLITTGNSYSYVLYDDESLKEEYQFKNRKFIRLEISSNLEEMVQTLFTNNWPQSVRKSILWIEVEPVKWFILNEKTLLCEKIIFSAVEWGRYDEFQKSFLYRWMNEKLKYELFQQQEKSLQLGEKSALKEKDEIENLQKLKKLIIKSMEDPEIRNLLKEIIKEEKNDCQVNTNFIRKRQK